MLDEPRGVFVTLHKQGDLRGCIGMIEARKPLWIAVRDAAVSAATRDPRFQPVSADELPSLHFEISALTPMEQVAGEDDVIVGEHGLFIDNGYKSGLLLPQVATEWGLGPANIPRAHVPESRPAAGCIPAGGHAHLRVPRGGLPAGRCVGRRTVTRPAGYLVVVLHAHLPWNPAPRMDLVD